jgi:hypothetical protein
MEKKEDLQNPITSRKEIIIKEKPTKEPTKSDRKKED